MGGTKAELNGRTRKVGKKEYRKMRVSGNVCMERERAEGGVEKGESELKWK